MKKESTAIRLKKLMESRNLRQVDILNLTAPYCQKYGVKMNKSDLSQYCSGKTEPNQDKLFVLGTALNVNEAWLMGFDVPMERNIYEDQTLLNFVAELNDAQEILESAGFSVSTSDDSAKDIIIKTGNTLITCIHDYELVNTYESLLRKNDAITASTLLDNLKPYNTSEFSSAFEYQLKALGWTYNLIYADTSFASYVVFKNKDVSFNVSIDDYNIFVNDAESFYKERLQKLLLKSTQKLFSNTVTNENETVPISSLQHNDAVKTITPSPFNNVKDAKAFLASRPLVAALNNGNLSDQAIIKIANTIKTNGDN